MSLPDDWVICRFEELLASERNSLADGPFGSALKSADYTSSGCRIIRLNNVSAGVFIDANKAFIDIERFAELKRHEARAGDLVTAALGDPLGRTCIVPHGLGRAIVKADCFRSRLHSRIDSELIMYLLNSSMLARYFSDNSKGVGRVRITISTLRNALIPLPPENEQRRLAVKLRSIVGRANSAKAEAERALKATKALKVSGLRAGVTGQLTVKWREKKNELEPVEDLLSRVPPPEQGRGGRQATETTIAGVAGIAVNNPGTELPEGWSWTPLLRIARQETGHTPSRQHSEYWDGDIGWLGIKDARRHHGSVIDQTVQTITEAGLAASSARILPAKTVCLSRTASVGYVTMLGTPMATSQDFVTWTCSPALLPEYLMYALMAEGKGLQRFGRGSTHTTIYFPEIRAFNIALPPIEEQREIAARVGRLLRHAEILGVQANRSIKSAEELASKSITHAMSGRFSVNSGDDSGCARDLLRSLADEREAASKLGKTMRTGKSASEVTKDSIGEPEKPDEITAFNFKDAIIAAGGTISAEALWKISGLRIEEFYRCLRTEMAAGLIHESADKEHLLAH